MHQILCFKHFISKCLGQDTQHRFHVQLDSVHCFLFNWGVVASRKDYNYLTPLGHNYVKYVP